LSNELDKRQGHCAPERGPRQQKNWF